MGLFRKRKGLFRKRKVRITLKSVTLQVNNTFRITTNYSESTSSVGDASRVGAACEQDFCFSHISKQASCPLLLPTRDASPTELMEE